jgi:ribonuclease P/MRP protein subunit POP7
VRKLLTHIEARAAGPITFAARSPGDLLRQLEDGVSGRVKGGKGGKGARDEEVILKATGKAIEKLLGLVLHFQGENDVKLAVRTGSVGTVDDIVNKESADVVEEEEGSQVRRTSALEVGISLR